MSGATPFRGGRRELAALLRTLPRRLAGRGPDPSGLARLVLEAGAREALACVREAFLAKARGGTDAAGDRWAPLAPSTLARRGRGAEALRDTGRLLGSLSPQEGKVALRVLSVRLGEMLIGTDCPYAAYHHEGTGRLPRRRLWPPLDRWPEAWWRRVGQAMVAGVMEALRRGGRR